MKPWTASIKPFDRALAPSFSSKLELPGQTVGLWRSFTGVEPSHEPNSHCKIKTRKRQFRRLLQRWGEKVAKLPLATPPLHAPLCPPRAPPRPSREPSPPQRPPPSVAAGQTLSSSPITASSSSIAAGEEDKGWSCWRRWLEEKKSGPIGFGLRRRRRRVISCISDFFFLREGAVLLLLLELGTGFSWSPVSEPKNKKPRLTEQALGLGLPLEFQVVGYDYPTRLSRWDRFHLILLDILHFCTEAVFRVSCKSC